MANVSVNDIRWLSGWWEGEGSFYNNKAYLPIMSAGTTDKDIADRVTKLLGCNIYIVNKPNRKTAYHFSVAGKKAASWMMTLCSLMGQRRQAKIKEVLSLGDYCG